MSPRIYVNEEATDQHIQPDGNEDGQNYISHRVDVVYVAGGGHQ